MKTKKGSWVVTMTCEVEKQVICNNCTKEQAENAPFEHAIEEKELYQRDYSVTSVEENK